MYFADDDNAYSLRLFREMRRVEGVGVWRVGLSGGLRYEGPDVAGDRVVGFHVGWRPSRPFPLDMAAFAVHGSVLAAHPAAEFSLHSQRGFQESDFVGQLVADRSELVPLGLDCGCVWVWHTRTEQPLLNQEGAAPSDPGVEV